jgi:hypothetical protein
MQVAIPRWNYNRAAQQNISTPITFVFRPEITRPWKCGEKINTFRTEGALLLIVVGL